MTKISDMKEPRKNNGYAIAIFGDTKRGALVSQTHSALISFGSELERIIEGLIPKGKVTTIDEVLKGVNGAKVIIKPEKPSSGESRGIKSDLAIVDPTAKTIDIIELKNGYTFDTQKSEAAKKKLQELADYMTGRIGYSSRYYVCCYLAETDDEVMTGFKKHFAETQIMHFDDLCQRLGISRQEVDEKIKQDQLLNRDYFDLQAASILEDESEAVFFQRMSEQRSGQPKLFYDED